MPTFDENEMNNETGEGYWEIALRRKWSLIVPFFLVFTVTSAIGFSLPKIYEANTLIMVEAPKVPQEYVQSLITNNTDGWLATIREQVLSRSLLKKVVDEYSLDQLESNGVLERFLRRAQKTLAKLGIDWKISHQKSQVEIVEEMREKIAVGTVGGGRSRVVAFSLSYEGQDPETVMNVTNRITSLFIEKHLQIREALVEGTSQFLEMELNRLRKTLEEKEAKISGFKRKYNGVLPSQLDANLRALDRFQLSMESANRSIEDLEARNALIEKEYPSNESIPLNGSRSMEANPVERLPELKRKLAVLRSEYKDTYPDILIVKREIQEIEDRQFEPFPLSEAPLAALEGRVNRKVHVLLLEGESQLKRQIDYRDRLLSKIREYEGRVEQIPIQEQELAVLVRDYDNTQENYRSLLSKRLNAKISENLEKRQKGEMFRIIDLAEFPGRPIKPNLLKIFLLGFVGGLASGVGFVCIREQADTSFHNPDDLERSTGLVVLAAIPNHIRRLKVLPPRRGGYGKWLAQGKAK